MKKRIVLGLAALQMTLILSMAGCANKDKLREAIDETTIISLLADEEEKMPVNQANIELIQYDESIYTNLKTGDDGKDHEVRLGFSLGIDTSDRESEDLKTRLAEGTPLVKDVIVGVLRNKTYEELIKSDAQAVLREEILENLQQEFKSNLIVTVYLNDLLLN